MCVCIYIYTLAFCLGGQRFLVSGFDALGRWLIHLQAVGDMFQTKNRMRWNHQPIPSNIVKSCRNIVKAGHVYQVPLKGLPQASLSILAKPAW